MAKFLEKNFNGTIKYDLKKLKLNRGWGGMAILSHTAPRKKTGSKKFGELKMFYNFCVSIGSAK